MKKAIKKQATYRLSESTIKDLDEIAKRRGLSHADVIGVLVHAYNTGEWDEDRIDEWFDIAQRT